MTSLLLSRRDLEFLLYDWLKVEDLTALSRFADHSRGTFDAALDLSESLAVDYFAPHNKLSDQNEPKFDNGNVKIIPEVAPALAAFRAAGLFAATADYDLGGMQLPVAVAKACMAYFNAANIATTAFPFLTVAAANLLQAHGSVEQVERFVRPMLEGRYFGTMCLSEPQAGSSLADITTRAEPQDDGHYRLFGRKMWISGGEHDLSDNIVHMVLARIPSAPAGVKGISLFVVPKYVIEEEDRRGPRNDVVLAGLNHKMGYRGTPNALLNFGEGEHTPEGRAGAIGYLVGEPHQGLAYMFHMMNEARIGVGLGAAALGYTGFLQALDYARNRSQGRTKGQAVASPPSAIIEHADVRRMLLAQKAYVEGGMALVLYCARLVDVETACGSQFERDHARGLLDMLTPVAKSWPSQWCLEANNLAIQVHGGYGYTRDYNVEQLYRDNRLNAIHEGTHGIQGLDLLGRKVAQRAGADLELTLEEMSKSAEQARATDDADLVAWADALQARIETVRSATASLNAITDPALRLANASLYLEAFGHVAVAWIWLQQAIVAHGRVGDFYDGKRQACRYFFVWELPKTDHQLALLTRAEATPFDMLDAWF